MPANYFLKIEGIDGESQGRDRDGYIDILSFSWGLAHSGSISRGGGAGKAVFQDFNFSAAISKASPKLMLACATGQHIGEAKLVAEEDGEQPFEFYEIKFTDVLISSFQQVGSPDGQGDRPIESISLNFAKIEVEYRKPGDSPVKAGHDLKENKKV